MNKYLIISKNGNILDPKDFLKSADCSEHMKIVIEREALGIKAKNNLEKPSYLKYANKMGFSWEPNSAIGFIQYDYKANLIMRILKEYSRNLVDNIGLPIYEVSGSNFFDLQYPVVQAYAGLFGDRLFKFKSEDKELVMSYDASYPQFNLASQYRLSEKNLPMAHFSISDCYRYEQSGECMLLFRGRRFNMPDLHPYLKSVDEAFEWYFEIEKQILQGAKDAQREYINVAKVSSEKNWNIYKDKIINIAVKGNKDMLVEIKMDNVDRYWIVDIDYSFIDELKQIREVGCIQIDIGNAERLGIKYSDKNNNHNHPVIIHAAVPGGLERYLYMCFDKFKESFPIWLQPIQVRLIPVSDKFIDFCVELKNKHSNIRIDIDDRAEGVGKKIKDARRELIPNIVVIGEDEFGNSSKLKSFENIVNLIQKECESKYFIDYNWPMLVSKQVK
jgi:threonyl-tRNA synthetase